MPHYHNETIYDLYMDYLESPGVTTDSRNVAPNELFFALRGDKFNGNAFAKEAIERGAKLAIIDDAAFKKDERYVLVDDVLDTLQKLATYHREHISIPIIGITGSSGKTTTKELMKAVLSKNYITQATKGNLNNQIGVPLTILGLRASVDLFIVEMGANHVGEISKLCEIAQPTHGLITNVGHVHIEGFGSFEGVVQGKSELYDYLRAHNGVIFVNSTDAILHDRVKDFPNTITYLQQHDFSPCEFVKEDPFVVCKTEEGLTITSQLLGHYHFGNIAAALCVGKYFNIAENDARDAIQAYTPSNNRSQVVQKDSNTIFLDAYNANLNSVKGAIKALNLMHSKHKVLILGDMLELGNETEMAHREVGKLTKQGDYQAVLLCGPLMLNAKKEHPNALHFPDKGTLKDFLKQQKFENTAFLIKGSRSLQLETLVESIRC